MERERDYQVDFEDNNPDVVISTELVDAAERGEIEEVIKLISSAANVNKTNNLGITALGIAVQNQNIEIIEFLLELEDINADIASHEGITPLMDACRKRDVNPKIIQMLLQHGCSLDKIDIGHKRSPIHFAVEVGSMEIIKLLIENGADINVPDINKDTALHIAMQRKDAQIVAMLLYFNVDTSLSNVWGPPIQEAKPDAIRELLLPYTDLCNEDVLSGLDIATFKFIWNNYQTKTIFGQWLLEDIQTRMRFLFVIFRTSRERLLHFLYELFEDEEMVELMYHPETSACLISMIPFSSGNQESVTVDLLRFLLSNSNIIKKRTLHALQNNYEFSPAIVRVLEDLDVTVEEDVNTLAYIQLPAPTPAPLLWRMFYTPRVNLEEDLLQVAKNDVVVANRFYAIGRKAPSLMELSRNKIRDTVLIKYSRMKPNKPFHYATVLKPMKVPRVLVDVLLLRKPLY